MFLVFVVVLQVVVSDGVGDAICVCDCIEDIVCVGAGSEYIFCLTSYLPYVVAGSRRTCHNLCLQDNHRHPWDRRNRHNNLA